MKAAKHILKFLKATSDRKLSYKRDEILNYMSKDGKLVITVYTDADFGSDTADHKSFTGFLIYVNGCLVDWVCRKQSNIATSTTESEYISLCEASKAVLHIYQLLAEFFPTENPITVYTDSESSQKMAENNLNSRRTKHIWIIYRFVTEWIKLNLLKLFHVAFDPPHENCSWRTSQPQGMEKP